MPGLNLEGISNYSKGTSIGSHALPLIRQGTAMSEDQRRHLIGEKRSIALLADETGVPGGSTRRCDQNHKVPKRMGLEWGQK